MYAGGGLILEVWKFSVCHCCFQNCHSISVFPSTLIWLSDVNKLIGGMENEEKFKMLSKNR